MWSKVWITSSIPLPIVKDAVRHIKKTSKEVFMPLSQRPGEAQVDFGHALANW